MFNLRSIDLNLLTVFEAIYEVGTVVGAAERLALSQSTVSHALSRLRTACSDELFVRAGQGLSPTPVANAMYPVIKQGLDALRVSLAEASGFDPTRSQRRFRVAIPHPLGPFYALDLKAAAAVVAPGIELTFETVSRPIDLEDRLRDGFLDLAIDWLPAELDSLINKSLFDDQLILVARRDHPSVRPGVTIDDLRKEKFVALHARRDIERRPVAIREFSRLGMHEEVRVSELLEVPTIVASTDLLGIMPLSIGPLLEKRLGLQVLPLPLEVSTAPIYIIWHETRRNDIGHRWLRELVEEKLGRPESEKPGMR